MKALIIEDEKLAAERLEELIQETDPSIEITAKLTSIKQSVEWLSENNADLIFLDIQLSDGLSFNIFDQIEVNAPIIFTTAYDQYALKAFKLNSVDYLLKPVKKSELEYSLNKLKEMKSQSAIDFEELLRSYKSGDVEYKKRFLIQYGAKILKVETKEAAAFYALDKNVFMLTKDKKNYPVNYTLDKLNDLLDPENFFRINRQMIINIDAVTKMVPYSRSRIKLELSAAPPPEIDPLVSVERSKNFKEWLDK